MHPPTKEPSRIIYKNHDFFLMQWVFPVRSHLQLRGQFRIFTGFPIKPEQAPSLVCIQYMVFSLDIIHKILWLDRS